MENTWKDMSWEEIIVAYPEQDTAATTFILAIFQGPKESLKFTVGPTLTALKQFEVDEDCKSGPIHVLLVKYDFLNNEVEIFWERLDFFFNQYWVDPWNQGVCGDVYCAVCCVLCCV
jgi:hypothetical protein